MPTIPAPLSEPEQSDLLHEATPIVHLIDVRAAATYAQNDGFDPRDRLSEDILARVGASATFPPLWLADGWWRASVLDDLRALAGTIVRATAADAVASGGRRLAYTLPLWRELAGAEATVLVVDLSRWERDEATAAAAVVAATGGASVIVVDASAGADVLATRIRTACARMHGVVDAAKVVGVVLGALARRADGARATDQPLDEATAEFHAALVVAASGRSIDDASDLAARVLAEARLRFERSMFDEGFARQRALGAAEAAVRDVDARIAELAVRREEYERQLVVVDETVGELRERLRKQLGEWCSFDELGEKGERIRELLRHTQAVRASWTYRIAMVLALPIRAVVALRDRWFSRSSRR